MQTDAQNLLEMAKLPQTHAYMVNLANPIVNQLVEFYGIPNSPVATKYNWLLEYFRMCP